MSYDPEALAKMSGADNFGRPESMVLNEVSLNGDSGRFRKRIYVGHDRRSNERPEEEDLGDSVRIIFLKVRRKLVERSRKGEIVRQTSEHNTVNSTVSVWPEKVYGKAADIRARFEGLRTVQVVYGLLLNAANTKEPELVKLIVKGASLGSEAKEKDVPSFYQYLSSYKAPEHFFQFQTILKPVEEHGAKTYYCMTFERGAAISEQGMELVAKELTSVHEKLEEQDSYVAKKADVAKEPTAAPGDGVDAPAPAGGDVQYPDEEINPDDIPF